MRTLSYLLHPPLLEEGGISLALSSLISGLSSRTATRLHFHSSVPEIRFPNEVEMALYRVAQEALINVQRHADAHRATVRFSSEAGRLKLEVEDDGIGIDEHDSQKMRSGVGLQGMRARIRQLGGSLSISRLERGTRLCAVIPLDQACLELD